MDMEPQRKHEDAAVDWPQSLGDWALDLAKNGRGDAGLRALRAARAASDAGRRVFPPQGEIFAALRHSGPEAVRVVILGQDPYHGEGQAHGLSFSVKTGTPAPPSLRNILREIAREYGAEPQTTDLTFWARQGVLLLNSVLTVEEGRPGSHAGLGWETFTDGMIEAVSERSSACAFLLWGAFAKSKAKLINQEKHLILESPHPSPLSAHRGFLGNGHFQAANAFLREHGEREIDWIGA